MSRIIMEDSGDVSFENIILKADAVIKLIQSEAAGPSEAATILMVALFIMDKHHRRPGMTVKDLIHVVTESLLNLDESVTMERLQ